MLGIPYSIGTLYVDENTDPKITGGVIQYRIYKTGDIFYSGEVSCFLGLGGQEVQVPFAGSYKVAADSVLTANYTKLRTVDKVTFKPSDTGQHLTVDAFVSNPYRSDSPDATGKISVNSSSELIEITGAELEGTVFANSEYETRLKIKLSNQR
jgi:hypothetical protein